jgi:hypothetical protein
MVNHSNRERDEHISSRKRGTKREARETRERALDFFSRWVGFWWVGFGNYLILIGMTHHMLTCK